MKYLSSFLLYYPSHLSYLSSYFITKSLLIFSDLSSINTIVEISRHFYIFQWTFNFTKYIFSAEYRGDFYLSLLYFVRYSIVLLAFLILQNTYSMMWYYVCSSSVVLLERLKLFSFSLDVSLKTSNYILLIDGINYRSLFTRRLTYIVFHDAEFSFPFPLCSILICSIGFPLLALYKYFVVKTLLDIPLWFAFFTNELVDLRDIFLTNQRHLRGNYHFMEHYGSNIKSEILLHK